jgi:hypothetical protein
MNKVILKRIFYIFLLLVLSLNINAQTNEQLIIGTWVGNIKFKTGTVNEKITFNVDQTGFLVLKDKNYIIQTNIQWQIYDDENVEINYDYANAKVTFPSTSTVKKSERQYTSQVLKNTLINTVYFPIYFEDENTMILDSHKLKKNK